MRPAAARSPWSLVPPLLLFLAFAACGRDAPDAPASAPPAASAAAPVPEPHAAPPQPAPGRVSIHMAHGRATLVANQASLLDALRRLARAAGFSLDTGDLADRPVSARVENAELPAALAALLDGVPYAASYVYDWRERQHRLVGLRVGERVEVTSAAAPVARAARQTLREATQHRVAELRDRPAETPGPEALAQALASRDARARARAAARLVPEGRDLDTLIDLAGSDPDATVREAVVGRLEDADGFAAVEALLRALDDRDPAVVAAAIESLEMAGDESVIPYLERFLEDPDEDIREAAQDAVEFLGE